FLQVQHGVVKALQRKPHAGKKRLIWAEFPGLAPPWNVPEDMLYAYFDEPLDTSAQREQGPPLLALPARDSDEIADEGALEPWPNPPPQLPGGDEHLDRLQFTYAAVVTYVDAQLGWILDKLRKNGLLEQTLVVMTASRTLPLAEHGWVGYQRAWQHEENV